MIATASAEVAPMMTKAGFHIGNVFLSPSKVSMPVRTLRGYAESQQSAYRMVANVIYSRAVEELQSEFH